jgi:hypothetical protein
MIGQGRRSAGCEISTPDLECGNADTLLAQLEAKAGACRTSGG